LVLRIGECAASIPRLRWGLLSQSQALVCYAEEVIRGLESDNYSNALSEDEHNEEDDDIAANVVGGPLTYITAEFLNRCRKDGPFGKLHNIGVHFRQNNQLFQAFRNAQQPCKTPLAWIHNVAIR
jgi:hypothetical protein